MAPSLTETLFALDLGERVVGVTPYCDYPPEAASRPRVGAYLDPNYEAIVALTPDLVVLMQDQSDVETRLRQLGVRTLRVDQGDLEGILESIEEIARACGIAPRGRSLALDMRARLREISQRTARLEPLRTLVVIDRDLGAGTLATVWAAGQGTFYQKLLEMAGGTNACPEGTTVYPVLSREGLFHLDPEVILEIVPDIEARGLTPEMLRAGWSPLTELQAVRDDRVHLLHHDFMVIPGPRIAMAVEAIARVLHPQQTSRTP